MAEEGYDYYQGRPELAKADRIVEERIRSGKLRGPKAIGEAFDQLEAALEEVREGKGE